MSGKRNIVVAQDGSGDCATICAALETAADATQEKWIDILVRPGIYTERITTRNWVNLVGEDRDTCVIRYDAGTVDGRPQHTVSATSNATIRNLTILGIRVKYCIHSDGPGRYILTLDNCVIRREKAPDDPGIYVKAYGIGLHGDQHVVMKDCLIEADAPVYLHNYPAEESACSMTLKRCALRGKGYAIDVFLLGSGRSDALVIHDSILSGASGIIYRNGRNEDCVPPWRGENEMTLVGSGNTISTIVGTEMRDDAGSR